MNPARRMIDILKRHPDYGGSIETEDMPIDFTSQVYEYLQANGDNINEVKDGAFGYMEGGDMLAISPEDGGFKVYYTGSYSPEVTFEHVTPEELLKVMVDIVGRDEEDLKMFRDAIEDAYLEEKEYADGVNSEAGGPCDYIEIPGRASDVVISKALSNIQR